MTMQGLRGILFDKDGTLFDFQATWGNWARDLLHRLAGEDTARAQAMAEALRFDLASGRFDRASPVIAGTGDEVVDLLAPYARMSRAALSALVSGAASRGAACPGSALAPASGPSARVGGCVWALPPMITKPSPAVILRPKRISSI